MVLRGANPAILWLMSMDLPESLPTSLADTLRPLLTSLDFRGRIAPDMAGRMAAEAGLAANALLRALVPVAASFARPAISHYHVGAVARGRTGALYLGMNMEFPGHTLNASGHGERSAVATAFAHGEPALEALAVSATPCGYCRQFLWELEDAETLTILLPDQAPITLPDLLPRAFGPGDLGMSTRLLQPQAHGLHFDATDDVARAALEAANASHAPYSGCPAGLAIELLDGRIMDGRLAENAAYSPTQSPIEAALALVCLAGAPWEMIAKVILVQKPGTVDHTPETLALLDAIAPRAELIVVGARTS